MPPNRAAYLVGAKVSPLEVRDAPYTAPGKKEVVIRNRAVAIKPLDWLKQANGDLLFSWIKYPSVLGSDVAGEVVEIGSDISRFEVGDRVVGHAVGTDENINRNAEGGFQTYTVLQENMASPVPSSLSFGDALVLPLGLSTGACGLFERDQLAFLGSHDENQ